MSRARASLLMAVPALLLACKGTGEDQESNLARRASEEPTREASAQAKAPAAKADPKEPGPEAGADKTPAGQLMGEPPPPDAERVTLALSLPEGTEYVIHTVGNVKLPLLGMPVAFAKDERVVLSSCSGEGLERRCKMEHHVEAFEAEGEAGSFLENDEARVEGIRATQTLLATGAQEGEPSLEGDLAETPAGAELADAHFFFCLRFPDEPVAKGAKWRDTCKRRLAGVVATREVLWEVSEISDDPDGGKRAELRYVGRYQEPAKEGGERRGTIQGVLYFHVDGGEPHAMREQISVSIDPAKGLKTVTQISYTFGRVTRKGKKEVLTLTDGKPFPEGINTRQPAPEDAPSGP